MRIDVTQIGMERSIRVVRDTAQRANNLYPVMQYIVHDFERLMAEQFATEGASTGTPWRALSDEWWDHKVSVGKDHGILQFNRTLVDSLTNSYAPGAVRDIRDDEVTMGTSVWYGMFHIHGTRRMPRRNFMRIPANTQRHWTAVVARYIETGRLY